MVNYSFLSKVFATRKKCPNGKVHLNQKVGIFLALSLSISDFLWFFFLPDQASCRQVSRTFFHSLCKYLTHLYSSWLEDRRTSPVNSCRHQQEKIGRKNHWLPGTDQNELKCLLPLFTSWLEAMIELSLLKTQGFFSSENGSRRILLLKIQEPDRRQEGIALSAISRLCEREAVIMIEDRAEHLRFDVSTLFDFLLNKHNSLLFFLITSLNKFCISTLDISVPSSHVYLVIVLRLQFLLTSKTRAREDIRRVSSSHPLAKSVAVCTLFECTILFLPTQILPRPSFPFSDSIDEIWLCVCLSLFPGFSLRLVRLLYFPSHFLFPPLSLCSNSCLLCVVLEYCQCSILHLSVY